MQSVLSRAVRDDIAHDPFAHLVLRGALDDAVCDELIAGFPPLELIARGGQLESNKRFDYGAAAALTDPRVAELWREIVATHVSQSFLDEALALFGEDVLEAYPFFEHEFGALESLRAGVRRRDSFEAADVLLDAQISVNTPVTGQPSSVRRGHLDANNKLFVGLFYLRHPEDRSTGGELELYRYATDHPRFTGAQKGAEIDDSQLALVQTVPYERNELVFFPNSRAALHGVTPRSETPVPRLFLNLVAEVRKPLFQVEPAKKPRKMRSRGISVRTSRPKLRRVRRPTWAGATAAAVTLILMLEWIVEAVARHDYDFV